MIFFLKIELQLLFFAVLVSSVQQRDIQYVLAVYFTCNSVYLLTMIVALTQTVYIEELCQWVEQEGKIVGNVFQIQIHGIENKRRYVTGPVSRVIQCSINRPLLCPYSCN